MGLVVTRDRWNRLWLSRRPSSKGFNPHRTFMALGQDVLRIVKTKEGGPSGADQP